MKSHTIVPIRALVGRHLDPTQTQRMDQFDGWFFAFRTRKKGSPEAGESVVRMLAAKLDNIIMRIIGVLAFVHSNSHLDIWNTTVLLHLLFFWGRLLRDVVDMTRRTAPCWTCEFYQSGTCAWICLSLRSTFRSSRTQLLVEHLDAPAVSIRSRHRCLYRISQLGPFRYSSWRMCILENVHGSPVIFVIEIRSICRPIRLLRIATHVTSPGLFEVRSTFIFDWFNIAANQIA